MMSVAVSKAMTMLFGFFIFKLWLLLRRLPIKRTQQEALGREVIQNNGIRSVAGGSGAARHFDGFGQAPAHRSKDEGGHLALRSQRYAGSFSREFRAAVQPQTRFFQELNPQTPVFGPVHHPA